MKQHVLVNPKTIKIKIPLKSGDKLLVSQKEFARITGVPEATLRDNYQRLKDMIENDTKKKQM